MERFTNGAYTTEDTDLDQARENATEDEYDIDDAPDENPPESAIERDCRQTHARMDDEAVAETILDDLVHREEVADATSQST